MEHLSQLLALQCLTAKGSVALSLNTTQECSTVWDLSGWGAAPWEGTWGSWWTQAQYEQTVCLIVCLVWVFSLFVLIYFILIERLVRKMSSRLKCALELSQALCR